MDFADVIKELEEEEAMKAKRVTLKIFKSMLNQPSLVTINSANAVKTGSQNGFSTFTADFARSILDVDTLQLVSTSIPQANASIPDTATTFWYYRLSQLTGTTPCLNNLYCARLLPSFYKPEFIKDPQTCGFNKTFKTYAGLGTELGKSTTRDIGYENLTFQQSQGFFGFQDFPFLSNDISLTYNSMYNKFQMTGNTKRLAFEQWSGSTTYGIGAIVMYQSLTDDKWRAYISLTLDNLDNNPELVPTSWEMRPEIQTVPLWNANTEYARGNLVSYENGLWQEINDVSYSNAPSTEGGDWLQLSNLYEPHNYLITGYDDPNVAIKQGELFEYPWEQTYYYRIGDRVKFQGRYFEAMAETNIYVPANVKAYNPATAYDPYSVVFYNNKCVRYNFDLENPNIRNWTELKPNPVNQPIWVSTVLYNDGDTVYQKGLFFKSIADNDTIALWNNATFYPAGTIIGYDDVKYRAVIGNRAVGPDAGAITLWFPNSNYLVGMPAYVVGVGAYICILPINGSFTSPNGDPTHWQFVNGSPSVEFWWEPIGPRVNNQNKDPFTNPTYWQLQAEHPIDAIGFIDGITYPRYSISNFNNQVWIANKDTTTQDASDWNAIGRTVWTGYNYEPIEYVQGVIVYFNGGYYISNQGILTTDFVPVPLWTPANAYLPNTYVSDSEFVWLSLEVSPAGVAPAEPAWQNIENFVWTPISTAIGASNSIALGIQSGLAGLTKEHDFIIALPIGEDLDIRPFPVGIAGQPFTASPKRLLNSILGFTWNAVFQPSLLTSLGQGLAIEERAVPLYNRLRPVPNYEVIEPPVLLTEIQDYINPPATKAYTYTADGYANLVYSSIISIYTNIVGGATLDTMRDTNLLATTTMNCGNLGIAYHANYIDIPLLRVAGGDVDSMYIELRDEMGDPFYLTNNAVMTLTFKVTYRERPRVE